MICGCGYVGATLGLLLNAGGHEVFGLRRDPSKLPPGITPIRADLSETLSPQALPTHLAAVFYAVSPDEGRDDAYRLAYVDGLRKPRRGQRPRRPAHDRRLALRPPRRNAGKSPNPSKDSPRSLQQTLLQRKAPASGYAFRYPTFREGFAALLDGGTPDV